MTKEIIVGVLVSLITAALMWSFSGIREVGNSLVPSGTVSFFNLTACPDGWAEFKEADGRFIVASGATGDSKNTYSIGQQGGNSQVRLVVENIPIIELHSTKLINKTTYKTAPVTDESVGALVEAKVNVTKIGNGESINVVPEYISLKACTKA